MKALTELFALAWLSGLPAAAQQLQGRFALDSTQGRSGLASQVFTFTGNRFTHMAAGCLTDNSQEDRGRFTVRHDMLTLHYDQWQQAHSTFTNSSPTQTGSPLRLLVLDAKTSQPVHDLFTVASPAHPRLQYRLDEAGGAVITSPLSGADSLLVSKAGYVTARLPVRQVRGRKTVVRLAPRIYRAPGGTSATYLLKHLTPDSFALYLLEPAIPWASYFRRVAP